MNRKLTTLGTAYAEYLEDVRKILTDFDMDEVFGPLAEQIHPTVADRFAKGKDAIATQIIGEVTYYSAMRYDEGFPNPVYLAIANVAHWTTIRAFIQGMQYMVDQTMLLDMVPEMQEMLEDILEAMYEANLTIELMVADDMEEE